MPSGEKTIHLYHNVVAPYRLPIFNQLSEQYDLTVHFAKEREAGRKWNTNITEDFKYDFLPSFNIGPFCLLFTIPLQMLRDQPDVHLHGESHQTLMAILSSIIVTRLVGGEIILWCECIDTKASKSNYHHTGLSLFLSRASDIMYRFLRPVIYREANVLIAYSEKSYQFLRERGVAEEKIVTGHQIMPKSCLSTQQVEDNNESEDTTTYLFIGYLERRKGLDTLLEAWTHLDCPDAELIIAGSGPERDRLEEGDDETVNWVGYVDEDRKVKLLREADVFVLPTRHDPWGLVVNEALMYNIPVVTTEAAGASELLRNSDAGRVIEPDDATALASAMVDLKHDGTVSERLRDYATDVSVGVRPFKRAIEKVLS
ncbi:glycosyltransferase family 4 protein [Halomicrobium sp. LC1Hm]|uniref:glycosyltransferase family 4 protein n=1 Tax=Halomicrobium sp. LC1Hm TaxID=2610902 RepID=UPI0012AA9C98|nr:glycosyltransferase family 4 protein [Halomicrobium sp. LC1Hm]QGA81923.1 Glycosyltransferase [Halomicrobium sp. LC1Hm]